MIDRSPRAPVFASLVLLPAVLVSAGCKKGGDEPPEGVPAAASVAPATTAVPEPVAAPAAEPPTEPIAAASASVAAPTPAQPVVRASDVNAVKSCCAALHGQATSAAAKDKATLTTAASVCDGIAKRVASGTTPRSAALISIRAAMRNGALPSACR